MKLSEHEQDLVAKLEGYQRRWPMARWILVMVGAAIILGSIFNIVFTDEYASLIGVIILVYTIMNWSGNPTTALLLRVVDELDESSGQKS